MAKRSNGEGCITKTSNGKWSARIQIGFKSDGSPKIKTFSGKTRNEVTKRLNEYKKQLANNIDILNGKAHISECIINWLETYKKVVLKPTSYDRLEVTIKSNIIPYIGDNIVIAISSMEIQKNLINKLFEKGLSYSTIKKVYNALNSFFKQYLIDGVISKNPMLGVTLPSSKMFNTKEISILTQEDIEKFCIGAVQKYKNADKLICRNGYAYVFLLFTGLRLSEALSLRYSDIDTENGIVKINRNVVSVKDRNENASSVYTVLEQESTKTNAGTRTVPLCQSAIDAYIHHKELYCKNENDYIFKSRNGKLVSPRNFAKSLNMVYKRCGINASGAHILRHTFASMLFAKGVNVKLVSQILGHSNIQVTYDTYIHLIKEQEMKAVNLLDIM